VLRDCVMAACSNSSQLMTSLIPIYAAMIAALHLAVGADVGAFIIESLATSLHTEVEKEREILMSESESGGEKGHKHITSKLSNNALLLLVYLYNLRVLHHTLIVDLMTLLAGSFQSAPSSSTLSQASEGTWKGSAGPLVGVAIGELEVELLVCLVDHCGAQLRADDPIGLKTAITTLTRRSAVQSDAENAAGSTRLRFMLEALTDLRNNKSRRIQSANADVVKGLRHWLGTVKNSLGGGRAGIDLCLRVSLTDLLDAEKTGRWWKAGASWAGKKRGGIITSAGDDGEGEEREPVKKQCGNPEEEKLLVLAQKMRFNTATRRNIFVVIMSSRDVDDAFERLQRMELKGKQDREVVRVISECCAQEKSYNAFYSELAAMLCSYNRQYKTSIQFIFWDNFKLFEDEVAGRRTVNLARLLAHLVCGFHLPLAVLKPIDMTDLNANMMLFLATFFMALFSAKVNSFLTSYLSSSFCRLVFPLISVFSYFSLQTAIYDSSFFPPFSSR
jgi:nucleolar MIF4G domain-containing protein 1